MIIQLNDINKTVLDMNAVCSFRIDERSGVTSIKVIFHSGCGTTMEYGNYELALDDRNLMILSLRQD